ncbi:MAG: (2Fe-2S)-binding protein [candidate division KSB1 bacterium]|nr:(2Fe-2S)-binding protein [candidate division KSB1 bacterium]MDZ7304144.1 (2Fe-2S)-binding protein [candidate division KSB1 bacterium]MDZ7314100.1 (2Fe-2S)-binding protein [candidate division KSB1 bacterium]
MKIAFVVNGETRQVDVPPMKRLLDVLREDLRLTGTKEGCGEGECGACSVFVNAEVVNSCLVPICQVEGAEVQTIESLASDDRLHPLQETMLKIGGTQCGICTPGILMAAKALLDQNPHPTRDDIRAGLSGNLCRCTGYVRIIDAVEICARNTGGPSVSLSTA